MSELQLNSNCSCDILELRWARQPARAELRLPSSLFEAVSTNLLGSEQHEFRPRRTLSHSIRHLRLAMSEFEGPETRFGKWSPRDRRMSGRPLKHSPEPIENRVVVVVLVARTSNQFTSADFSRTPSSKKSLAPILPKAPFEQSGGSPKFLDSPQWQPPAGSSGPRPDGEVQTAPSSDRRRSLGQGQSCQDGPAGQNGGPRKIAIAHSGSLRQVLVGHAQTVKSHRHSAAASPDLVVDTVQHRIVAFQHLSPQHNAFSARKRTTGS